MSELTDVLDAIESLAARGERMSLATIVSVKGSTYRRPGARLLVPEEGAPVGNISGGCLEGDVADVARIVMRDGVPRIAAWDLTADDDDVWGLGLGCNGADDGVDAGAQDDADAAHRHRNAEFIAQETDHQRAESRHRLADPADRLLDQGAVGKKPQQVLGRVRPAHRPETAADAAGHDDAIIVFHSGNGCS